MRLFEYQASAVRALAEKDKHYVIAGTGTGKTAIALSWAYNVIQRAGAEDFFILVVTTATKRDSGDFEREARVWAPGVPVKVISWQKCYNYAFGYADGRHKRTVVIFDECQKGAAGVSSGMGRGMFKLAYECYDFAGFTATPGDNWLKFYPYFQATGLVKNKTSFLDKYAVTTMRRGFPEIIRWDRQDELKKMWEKISITVDASSVISQLPAENDYTVTFRLPSEYKKIRKTRTITKELLGRETEYFLDTPAGYFSALRSSTLAAKKKWIQEFVEDLGERCVFFVNFISEEDEVVRIAEEALKGTGAKVWRIDGTHHEIPTAETMGKRDVIVAHYASGGEALNLQFVNYMVFVSPNYSYSMYLQAKGRIRRVGQKRPQFYYHLMCEKSIESEIYKTLGEKRDFSEEVWFTSNGD